MIDQLENPGRNLIVVTSANQLSFTVGALNSLMSARISVPHEILLVDDASHDGTVAYAMSRGIRVISKSRPLGLTDSWNRAYQVFRDGPYRSLFLSNNDILIPGGAVEAMAGLIDRYGVVGPLTSKRGAGHQPEQAVGRHYRLAVDDSKAENFDRVQYRIAALPGAAEAQLVPFVNGFFFALSRAVIPFELEDGNLFDPRNANVGNEDELQNRLPLPKAIALRAFVFHYKGVSFSDYRLGRHLLLDRNLLWSEARAETSSGKWPLLYRSLVRRFYSRGASGNEH